MEREQAGNTVFNKDFTLVVFGQIISLFGNSILRFALPLYLLRQTGSAVLFGLVSAISFVPMILLSLVGGVVADRLRKQRIMVVLDFCTAALVIAFGILLRFSPLVPLMLVTLMLLYGIQGAYQPAVQASIPALLKGSQVVSGNAVINQVSAFSSLVGPVVGGWLMGIFGLRPILQISAVCFFVSAVMELFIRIPHVGRQAKGSMWQIVKTDLSDSFSFVRREKPILTKIMVLIVLINLFLSALIMVGLPVIVTQTLALGDVWMGYCQAALAVGSLLGGVFVGIAGSRLTLKSVPCFLYVSVAALLPMAVVLLLHQNVYVTYAVVLCCCVFVMFAATASSIQILAFVQTETPPELVGKVISCVMAIAMSAQPLGQAMYGILFQNFGAGVIILGAAVVSFIISSFSHKVFSAGM